MNIHNSAQAYLRPATNIGVRQHLHRRHALDLPGGLFLWRAVGKVLLVILPVMLSINIFMASAMIDAEQSMKIIEGKQHELMDENIELLAGKAMLLDPNRVHLFAGEKLALSLPEKGQMRRFNRRLGNFTYL